MKRELILGGVFFLTLILLFLAISQWHSQTDGVTETIVRVEEGTVEVSNAFDPLDNLLLRSGEQVASSRGWIMGKERYDIRKPKSRYSRPDADYGKNIAPITSSSTTHSPFSATSEVSPYWVAGYAKGENGQPIPNCKIILHPFREEGPDDIWFNNDEEKNEEIIGSVTTNALGYFTIHVDEPRKMWICSQPSKDYLSLRDPIELTESQKNQMKQFIHPEAILSLTGTILDAESGKPIEGVDIGLICEKTTLSPKLVTMTQSASDGTFVVQHLIRGNYRLEAMAERYVRFDPHEVGNEEFLNIDVSAQNVDKNYVVNLKPGFAATVKILDMQQKPIEGVEIFFLQNTESFHYAGWGKTNREGIFSCTQLPKKSLLIRTKSNLYGSEISEIFQPGEQNQPTEITLALTSAGSITGKVIDKNGIPIIDQPVVCRFCKHSDWKQVVFEETQTAEDGTYRFPNLSQGEYQLCIAKAYGQIKDEYTQEVSILRGEEKFGVDFIIQETGRINGKIIDGNGNPVGGIFVLAVIDPESPNPKAKGAKTNKKGEFHIAGLPEGQIVQFNISDTNFARFTQREIMNADVKTLTLKYRGSVRGIVTNSKRESISGAQIKLLAEKEVPFDSRAVSTRTDGSFRIPNVDPGNYRVMVSMPGYPESQSEEFQVQENQTADTGIIVLTEAKKTTEANQIAGQDMIIRGIVYHNGQPEPEAHLILNRLESEQIPSSHFTVYSNTQGEYTFLGLKPGKYQLMASRKKESGNDQPFVTEFCRVVTISEDQTETRIDVFLSAYEIRVTVLDADSQEPLPDAKIRAQVDIHTHQKDVGLGEENLTHSNGTLSIQLNEPGHFEFSVIKEGYIATTFQVDFLLVEPGVATPPQMIEVRMQKQETTLLVSLFDQDQPLESPDSLQFFWIQNGIYFELPYSKETQAGLYKIDSMTEGNAEMVVHARIAQKLLISFPQSIILEKGHVISLIPDLLDSEQYGITLETTSPESIQPPIYYEIGATPNTIRQGIPLYANSNTLSLFIPKESHHVRLTIPGFLPIEFDPSKQADAAVENSFTRSLRLKLTPQ